MPLVCNSVTSIGCGSRSKPILLALEKHPEINDAYLKRDGTVIGVIWNNIIISNEQQKSIVTKVFNQNQVKITKLFGDAYLAEFATFSTSNIWYKRVSVNNLSKEEATIIAEQLVPVFDNKSQLNPQQKNF